MDPPLDLPPAPTAPAPRTPRPSPLLFFGIVLALFAALGTAAQASNPAVGLAWSEIFALLLPALVASTGWNLVPDRALLLARAPSPRALALAVVLGCAGFLAAGSIMALTSLLLPARWVQAFDVTKIFEIPGVQRTSIALVAATIAPLCEELTFRGWLLTALRARYRTPTAIVASALLFALMHMDPVRFPALLALGAVFAWLAWRSGSIWPSVLAHATNNTLGVLVASAAGAAGAFRDPRGSPGEIAASAFLMLGLMGGALTMAARGYAHATPSPPDLAEILQPRDPADPSPRFDARRVPRHLLGFAVLGAVMLIVLVLTGHAMRR